MLPSCQLVTQYLPKITHLSDKKHIALLPE